MHANRNMELHSISSLKNTLTSKEPTISLLLKYLQHHYEDFPHPTVTNSNQTSRESPRDHLYNADARDLGNFHLRRSSSAQEFKRSLRVQLKLSDYTGLDFCLRESNAEVLSAFQLPKSRHAGPSVTATFSDRYKILGQRSRARVKVPANYEANTADNRPENHPICILHGETIVPEFWACRFPQTNLVRCSCDCRYVPLWFCSCFRGNARLKGVEKINRLVIYLSGKWDGRNIIELKNRITCFLIINFKLVFEELNIFYTKFVYYSENFEICSDLSERGFFRYFYFHKC